MHATTATATPGLSVGGATEASAKCIGIVVPHPRGHNTTLNRPSVKELFISGKIIDDSVLMAGVKAFKTYKNNMVGSICLWTGEGPSEPEDHSDRVPELTRNLRESGGMEPCHGCRWPRVFLTKMPQASSAALPSSTMILTGHATIVIVVVFSVYGYAQAPSRRLIKHPTHWDTQVESQVTTSGWNLRTLRGRPGFGYDIRNFTRQEIQE